jgi:hypothetical protein
MMKVWQAYSFWKMGATSWFLSKLGELEGQKDLELCVE